MGSNYVQFMNNLLAYIVDTLKLLIDATFSHNCCNVYSAQASFAKESKAITVQEYVDGTELFNKYY